MGCLFSSSPSSSSLLHRSSVYERVCDVSYMISVMIDYDFPDKFGLVLFRLYGSDLNVYEQKIDAYINIRLSERHTKLKKYMKMELHNYYIQFGEKNFVLLYEGWLI